MTSPTSTAVKIDWAFTGNQVSGGSVTWTPDGSTAYDVTLTAGGQTLTFGSNIEASAVATAKVTIKEN